MKLTKLFIEYAIKEESVTVTLFNGQTKTVKRGGGFGYAVAWKLGIPSFSQNTITKRKNTNFSEDMMMKEMAEMKSLIG